jgi:aryl-alcohol dehydrogenase-like predicted oxidoreductase
MIQNRVSLGLGLISIGREWGVVKEAVPSNDQAHELLHRAIGLGIRFFDTAPAYGDSEARFGSFLSGLDSEQSGDVFVATKCGLHWDAQRGTDYEDHSYDALCRSIDQSLARLERIDLLQLHRATVTTMGSGDVKRAFIYAQSLGIGDFGASVSEVAAAQVALSEPLFTHVQLPFNAAHPSMQDAIALAAAAGKQVIVNRPFGMGQLLRDERSANPELVRTAAYAFVLDQDFSGVVLTGTKSPTHLEQNMEAFKQASVAARTKPKDDRPTRVR